MSNDEKKPIRNSTAEFLIFTRQRGEKIIKVRYEDETILRAGQRGGWE